MLHILLILIFILISYLIANYFIIKTIDKKLHNKKSWKIFVYSLYYTFSIIIILQICFSIIINTILHREGKVVQELYDYCFKGTGFFPGETIHYVEHHYLNYILNANLLYAGEKQINNTFKIRRSEPIRPKDQVKWRILILGGSTTFGEQIASEKDTWVYDLERLLRQNYGDTYDVINGGVGGYTIAENFIHYITLLYSTSKVLQCVLREELVGRTRNNTRNNIAKLSNTAITHLEPDVVLFYEGINDVHPRLFDNIRYDYSNYRIPWRSEGNVLTPANNLLKYFYPYRYFFLQRKILSIKLFGIGGVVSKPYPDYREWQTALNRNTLDVYRDYLENFVQLLRGQGKQVAIIPQYFKIFSTRDDIFLKGVNENNLINKMISTKYNLPYANHILDDNTFAKDDVFDNCHFNPKGSKKMAELIFRFLTENKLIKPQ